MSRPYLASEDSALLREALRGRSGGVALEIGAGNGGNLAALTDSFDTVVGTDIVMPEMRDWSEKGACFLLADAATCVRDETFDLVAFNPPYLPEEDGEDVAVEGGAELEVPLRFLRQALRAVKRTGRVVMLLNDRAPIGRFEAECGMRGFGLKRVLSRRVFFEELAVYEASALSHKSGRT